MGTIVYTMSADADAVVVAAGAEGIDAGGPDTQQIAVEWSSIDDAEDPNSIRNH